ncbi:MAG: hypothetical protein IPI20_17225 [Rhodoferax sp.]|nr:hypothetical protein [Rhodoferax sp.]
MLSSPSSAANRPLVKTVAQRDPSSTRLVPTGCPPPSIARTGLVRSAQAALICVAESTTNGVYPIRPFYWEIGDANSPDGCQPGGAAIAIAGRVKPIAWPPGALYASTWPSAARLA